MPHSRPRKSSSRSATLNGFKPALDRIDAYLERTNPELEQQKIDKVLLLMFGPRPSGFHVDPRFADRPREGIIPTINPS